MNTQTIAGFRLSTQQERVWAQNAGGVAGFVAECRILVDGPLDPARLREGFRKAVERHEILRTLFQRQAGLKLPFQMIQPEADFGWEALDLSGLDAASQEVRLHEVSARLAAIDLEQGPALRVVLAGLGPDRHSILLSLPALCADRSTLRNLLDEVLGSLATLPVPDAEDSDVLQYADVVEWQQELLTGDDTKAGRDFWRDYSRKLDLSAANLALAPHEVRSMGTFSPAVVTVKIGKALSADFLLTCWQVFVCRIANQSEITIACEFDGRKYDELAGAMGLFAKYIPLSFSYAPTSIFSHAQAQVTNAFTEAANWQDSFNWTSLGDTPLGAIAFEYAELPADRTESGTRFSVLHLESRYEGFEFKLAARLRGDVTALELHYDSSKLPPDTVVRWGGLFLTLVRAAAANPALAIGKLPLLDENERHRVLVAWNQTSAKYPDQTCLHTLFETQVELTPERTAVRCEDHELTYSELNSRANRLAHALRAQGITAGSRVGLCLDRGVEMIVGLLGILKAGGAYVPLSADYPKTRLRQQLTGAIALVTERKFLPLMPEFDGPTLCIDRELETHPATNPESITSSENLAYVIYTSGSTGTPKGVGIRHRNLVNYAWFIRERLQLEKYPDGLQFATVSTLSADLGNTCIYPSLISGGCLHVVPYEVSADSERLRAYTARYPVDVLKIVPSHLDALLTTASGGGLLPGKFLVTGGELLTWSLVKRIRELNGGCEILNHYGPTETTIGSLTFPVAAAGPEDTGGVPIGRPIANTEAYVLDGSLEPAPVGVTGELYIAGAGVTAGYLGQPELTAERFIANPFREGSAMYRTGDLVRYRADGAIEFLGRADDQVKIRGFRVELGEVQAVLSQHASVKQALVLARPDARGDKRLVAYVVGPEPAEDLRGFLKERLPDHMVPSAVMTLARLPLTANGKIDRQKLPEPEDAQSSAKTYAAPATPTEIAMAAVWADVLRRERVGATDNFFEIGGHSLLATQVISRVRRDLKIDLALRLIFELPTVAQLSAWADEARGGEQTVQPPPITRVPRDGKLPLSFAQQRLWLMDQLEPDNPSYNVPRTLRMKGVLRVDALERALNEIVRRHESQRTTFEVHAGQPVQIIAESMKLLFPIQDLSGEPDTEAAARRVAREEALQPFDLSKGPLIRVRLLHLSQEDHVLLFTAHHIVSDAWSAGIFSRELGVLYEAFTENRPSPLPELPVQYADYAAWQRNWLQGEVLRRELSYWSDQLRGAPPLLELPFDRPRSAAVSTSGAMESIPLSPAVLAALKRLGSQVEATLFMTLLAGFQTLLSRYSGQEKIVLGTDVANRTTAESENLIGFFINLLAICTDLSGNPTFRELLGRVRETALGAYAHQDMPFDKLVEELEPERKPGQNPIVQALFVMQNIPSTQRKLAGLELSSLGMPVSSSKFDVAIFMVEQEDRLTGNWVYRTDLFDRTTILRVARNFETLLANAAANPDTRLSALEIYTPDEKRRLSEEKSKRKESQYKKLKTMEPRTTTSVILPASPAEDE